MTLKLGLIWKNLKKSWFRYFLRVQNCSNSQSPINFSLCKWRAVIVPHFHIVDFNTACCWFCKKTFFYKQHMEKIEKNWTLGLLFLSQQLPPKQKTMDFKRVSNVELAYQKIILGASCWFEKYVSEIRINLKKFTVSVDIFFISNYRPHFFLHFLHWHMVYF